MPRSPNTPLQKLMQAAGLSPAQLAREMRAVAAEQGLSVACDGTTVRRWMDGTQPRPPAPALLLECLSRRSGRTVTAHEAGLTHAPATVVDSSWQADPVHKLTQLTNSERDPSRPTFGLHGLSLAALTVPDEITPTRRYNPPAQPATPASSTLAAAEHIRGMTALFHTAAQQYGGASVRAPIAAYLTHRVLPLLHTHTRAQIHRDLLSAAAQLTLMLGTMCADSGHDRTAQHYHQVAARLATDAGDSATLAIVLRAMATHAHNLGHHTPAVLNLAEQAVAQARHAPRVVQAYTQAHLGVVLAYHDRHAALTALAHAESLYTQTETAPGPFTAYPPGALYYQRGQTFIILGDPTNTLKSLNTSLRLRAPAECRASVLTRACLAETHLNLGHLDQAIAHWQTFLAAYPTLHSARAARHLRSLKEQLRPHQRYPAARQLLAQAKLLARSVSEST